MSEIKEEYNIEDALASLLGSINEIGDTEMLPLRSSFGRILAKDVIATFSVPSFPKSAMDGYAVCSKEVADASYEGPVKLKVIGEMLAGDKKHITYQLMSAVRVMTGAEVPKEYDAVIRQEDTDYGEDIVEIYKGVKPYTNYCKVGEDICEGDTVITRGSRIGRVEAGVLASLGIAETDVVRKLRVSIISTGSELREVGTPLEEGMIYNSIAYTIMGALSGPCFEVSSIICSDDAAEIENEIRRELEISDVVITTGGVSVGKKDLLPEVLDNIGAVKLFSRVNIQPGTPTIGSVKDGKAILSLSGNPFAALVNFDIYFWPLAAKLTGSGTFIPGLIKAELASEYGKVSPRRRMLRARYEDGRVYLPEKSHASSVLSNLMNCNCYIDVPADTKLKTGDEVRVRLMPVL